MNTLWTICLSLDVPLDSQNYDKRNVLSFPVKRIYLGVLDWRDYEETVKNRASESLMVTVGFWEVLGLFQCKDYPNIRTQ